MSIKGRRSRKINRDISRINPGYILVLLRIYGGLKKTRKEDKRGIKIACRCLLVAAAATMVEGESRNG
jgi:hypothetical protein